MFLLPIVNHPGVPIHLFTRHVLERHANDNEGFVRAFEHIESLAAASPSRSSPTRAAKENLASLLPHNVEKNRYKNVLACEYRVLLNIDSTQYAKRILIEKPFTLIMFYKQRPN